MHMLGYYNTNNPRRYGAIVHSTLFYFCNKILFEYEPQKSEIC